MTVGSKLGILLGPICGMCLGYGMLELTRVPEAEIVTEGLLYVLLSIYIVCGAMILGGLIIGRSPQRVLCQDIAWRLRVSADLLTGQNRDKGSWRESQNLLQKGALPLLTNVKLSGMEKIWAPEILNRLRQASLHAFSCLALSRMAVTQIGWKEITQNEGAAKIAQAMRDMAEIFERGDIAVGPKVEVGANEGEKHPALQEISEQLQVFSEQSKVPFPQAPKTGFILPGAFHSPENYRFATKGTLAVAIASCLYLGLDWGGIHTCVITCFLVGLPTVGEMVSKQAARIGGTLLGSVFVFWGMIYAIPHFTNIAQILLLVGAGFLASGWLKSGPERFSYFGFQVTVVLALSELGKNGPSFDLTTPRDRIIGIWIGLMITYIIFTRLWPTSSVTRLPPEFQKCFSALERQFASEDRIMRLFWASAAQGAIGGARNFLQDAKAERRALRSSANRLKTIGKALNQAQKLMETLLLPPTDERTLYAERQKKNLKRLLDEAELLSIPGKAPATEDFRKNPAPT
ncbi:fusaric acid resistance protein [Lasius niger]|uniref:Fusaric acid resistance protein n=1 Tax=Lasius niger TaxID=67767 RepID=A0A0J7KQ80_LASNI|nr:fusaric acid resistance protein [Lasius niger]